MVPAIDRDNLVEFYTSLADRTDMGILGGVEPATKATPTVQMTTKSDNWVLGDIKANITFERRLFTACSIVTSWLGSSTGNS